MKSLLSVLLVGVGFVAQARVSGPLHVWACRDVRTIVDAGYYANVDFDGNSLRADFGEQSLVGPRALGEYAVAQIKHLPIEGNNLAYVDKQTSGLQFTLEVNEGGTSLLRGKDNTGRWHHARLRCHRTRGRTHP